MFVADPVYYNLHRCDFDFDIVYLFKIGLSSLRSNQFLLKPKLQ